MSAPEHISFFSDFFFFFFPKGEGGKKKKKKKGGAAAAGEAATKEGEGAAAAQPTAQDAGKSEPKKKVRCSIADNNDPGWHGFPCLTIVSISISTPAGVKNGSFDQGAAGRTCPTGGKDPPGAGGKEEADGRGNQAPGSELTVKNGIRVRPVQSLCSSHHYLLLSCISAFCSSSFCQEKERIEAEKRQRKKEKEAQKKAQLKVRFHLTIKNPRTD